MAEDIRLTAKLTVPEAPHRRAWGGILVKAKKEGLIKKVGFKSTTNPAAHCALAGVWEKV